MLANAWCLPIRSWKYWKSAPQFKSSRTLITWYTSWHNRQHRNSSTRVSDHEVSPLIACRIISRIASMANICSIGDQLILIPGQYFQPYPASRLWSFKGIQSRAGRPRPHCFNPLNMWSESDARSERVVRTLGRTYILKQSDSELLLGS